MVLANYVRRFMDGPTVGRIDAPPLVRAVRISVLLLVVITVPLSTPHFGHAGQGLAIALALTVSAVSWAVWSFSGNRPWLWVITLAVMGAAGGALAGLTSLSSAVSVGFVVTISAGARLSAEVSGAIVAETVAAFLIAGIVSGATAAAIIGWTCGFVGAWAFGLTRRAYLLRALDAEAALEQARRAHKAETRAAALAERARIAREIHDVLAHALAAVSVNLQAAEGLLDVVPDKGPELAKAVECVERATALTKEGMAEARRAILALREDTPDARPGHARRATGTAADGETDRLTLRLRALVDEHNAGGDATVEFIIAGTPRPVGAEGGLTAYRTVQEALTNARKHAPGQPVTVTLTYGPDAVTLAVGNPLPEPGAEGPLAHAGTGYGLTGLRERAALAGGTLTAAAGDGRWTVLLTLPDGAGQDRRPARESAHDR